MICVVMQTVLRELVCITSNACFDESIVSDPISSDAILSRDSGVVTPLILGETPFLHHWKTTRLNFHEINTKQTPWPESASELYRRTERPLLTKLVSTFADRGVSRGQRGGSLRLYSLISRPEPLLFLPSSSSVVLTRLSGPRSRPSTS
jgi:hypothetical protein